MEGLLYKAQVDVAFAGRVHAYKKFARVYDNKANECGMVYITIGDEGNREGLAIDYLSPKLAISLFRKASFEHRMFEVLNKIHAHWSWHRNTDVESVMIDNVWVTNLASNPSCSKKK